LKNGDEMSKAGAIDWRSSELDDQSDARISAQLGSHARAARPQSGFNGSWTLTAKYRGSDVQVQLGTLPTKPGTVYVTSPDKAGQAVAEINALTELKLARPTSPWSPMLDER